MIIMFLDASPPRSLAAMSHFPTWPVFLLRSAILASACLSSIAAVFFPLIEKSDHFACHLLGVLVPHFNFNFQKKVATTASCATFCGWCAIVYIFALHKYRCSSHCKCVPHHCHRLYTQFQLCKLPLLCQFFLFFCSLVSLPLSATPTSPSLHRPLSLPCSSFLLILLLLLPFFHSAENDNHKRRFVHGFCC